MLSASDLTTIRRIARNVRRQMEAYGRQEGYSSDLCGLCAVATGRLLVALHDAGFDARAQLARQHCFITVGEYLVDVTATQFGREHPKVLIRNFKKFYESISGMWYRITAYDSEATFKSLKALRRKQVRDGWPEHQMAGK